MPRLSLNIHHFVGKVADDRKIAEKSPAFGPGIGGLGVICPFFRLAVSGEDFEFGFAHSEAPLFRVEV